MHIEIWRSTHLCNLRSNPVLLAHNANSSVTKIEAQYDKKRNSNNDDRDSEHGAD